ncbi:MAG: hemolysin III family protein [Peptococcaceae bacterium]|jgi:hemolysin III|nr:hemolysin III family protein [Peptococcaceae bacterium]
MRTKVMDIHLPAYSRGEEILNMVSHIVGGALGIVALVLCVAVSALRQNILGVVSAVVYGLSMILLYTMSSIYHGLTNETAKKVFRILDHCAIYILIAGSYTPITLNALRRIDAPLAWFFFGLEWGLAILAVTLTAIDIKKYQVFSMICYIAMGWGIVAAYQPVLQALTATGFILLLTGGILYTVGAVLYGMGKKRKFMHGVFHIFVFLGSLFQFLCVILYAL